MTDPNIEHLTQDPYVNQQNQLIMSKFDKMFENQQQHFSIFSNSMAECKTNDVGEILTKSL